MNPAWAWFRAFALTLAIEEAVVLLMTRRERDAVPKRALLVAFANLVTHPIVWFVIPRVIAATTPQLVVCEAWAIGGEALFYATTMRLPPSRALGVSAIANAASYGLGILLRSATGWV